MKLYSIKEKLVLDVPYITNDEGIFYTKFLTDEELKESGYLRVVQEEYPVVTDKFKKIRDKSEVRGDTYVISYEVVGKDLEELTELFKQKTQKLLDAKAKAKGYDDILSACSYAGFDNPFREEGEKFGRWRSEVWSKGYAILKDIAEGRRKLPESFKEILDELPILEEI